MQRILYLKHGWQMMKDHPVLGVGYFNFIPYYSRHHSDDLVLPALQRSGRSELPHNIIIQVGTDTGFTGLTVFLFLLVAAFWTMWRIGREASARGDRFLEQLSIGMNLSLLGYVVAGQFVTVAYYPYLWIHLAFVTMIHTFWKKEGSLRFPPGLKGAGMPAAANLTGAPRETAVPALRDPASGG